MNERSTLNSKAGETRDQMRDVRVSAVHLAELAGIGVREVHYWAQKDLLRRSKNGSKTPFHLSDLDKIQLMRYLTQKYDMEAVKAAHLADELLEMHSNEPHAYEAALALLEAFERGLGDLARILAGIGFTAELAAKGLLGQEGAVDPLQTLQERRRKNGDT